jgi:hypothetical protein
VCPPRVGPPPRQRALQYHDEREPGRGGAPRGAQGRRSSLARPPGQGSLPERQGVRAHAPGSGLRRPGHPHRDPAAHPGCRRQPHLAPRPGRVGDLRHGPDRLVGRGGDKSPVAAGPGARHDQRVQCRAGERRRGVVRRQRAGRFRADLGPSGRSVAQDLASGGVDGRPHWLYLRDGHGRHGDAPRGGRDGEPGVGGGGARRRLLLVGAALPAPRAGELSGGAAGGGGHDRLPGRPAGLLRPGLRAADHQERGQLRRAWHRSDRGVVADRRGLGPLRRPAVRALVPRHLAAGLGAKPLGPGKAGRRQGWRAAVTAGPRWAPSPP